MQLAWFGIWTCVAVSISYDDIYYTKGTSTGLFKQSVEIMWPEKCIVNDLL